MFEYCKKPCLLELLLRTYCINELFFTLTKYLSRRASGRNYLFQLTVSEQPSPIDQMVWQNRMAQTMIARKQSKRHTAGAYRKRPGQLSHTVDYPVFRLVPPPSDVIIL